MSLTRGQQQSLRNAIARYHYAVRAYHGPLDDLTWDHACKLADAIDQVPADDRDDAMIYLLQRLLPDVGQAQRALRPSGAAPPTHLHVAE